MKTQITYQNGDDFRISTIAEDGTVYEYWGQVDSCTIDLVTDADDCFGYANKYLPRSEYIIHLKPKLPFQIKFDPSPEKKEVKMTSDAASLRQQAKDLIEKAKLIESRPEDNFEPGSVLVFAKNFGRQKEYLYTAIKFEHRSRTWNGHQEHNWFVGKKGGDVDRGQCYYSWEGLLDFIESEGGPVDGIWHASNLTEVQYK